MKNEIDEVISSFVNKRLSDKIKEVLTTNKNAIVLDFNDVDQFSPALGDYLLKNPEEALETIKYFINETSIPHKELDIEVRIKNLPKNAQLLIREIRSKHIGLFIQVQGLIKTAASVKPVASAIDFECQSCGHITKVEQKEMTQRAPSVCTNCGKKGRFKVVKKYLVDTQRIMLEEAPEDLEGGEQPEHINIVLKKDLVDPKFERSIIPGNKVVVSGIINESAIYYPSGKRSNTSDTFILASYVEAIEQGYEDIVVTKEEEMAIKELANDKMIYTKFKNSIAPNIFGHDDIKEAIVMQLFGGVRKAALSGNSVIRGDIHILLVGDPGCLRADERIVLGNGAIVKIGNVGKTHLEEIKQEILTGEGYKKDIASTFHIYKNQQVMEVITESGKSIVGTFNHPLLVKKTEESGIVINAKDKATEKEAMHTKKAETEWKRLDEIKKGEYVRIITSIPCTINKLVETAFTSNEKNKMPKFMTEKLAGLIGYMIGKGWISSEECKTGFTVYPGYKDILNRLNSIVKSELNAEPHTSERMGRIVNKNRLIKNGKKLYYVDIDGKTISDNFSFLNEKRVPDSILQSGNKVFRSFLKWAFEADGNITVYNSKKDKKNMVLISYKSTNLELLRDIQIMLLRFSVQSSILFDGKLNGSSLIIKNDADVLKFYKKIGFASKKKTEKLKELVKSLENTDQNEEKTFERVTEVRTLGKEDVYDIEVPKSHRFIANGIISHNTSKSSLLKYVTGIAPKARYVVGMGSSAAGLTATIIKDEATRSYILEAGALPLTNKGLLMIDELDKMNKDDRVAMHEALEQQSISISKANIHATLTAQTSVLAAANPKLGRFNPFDVISSQIELPPTLINRFDLIFILKDRPDKETDTLIAQRILEANRDINKNKPEIPPNIMKKYIAYAKQNIKPKISVDAMKVIQDFYLKLRSQYSTEGEEVKPIPISARQLEAVVRLTEASAKVRLSDYATIEDAKRAIDLMMAYLGDVGIDSSTGQFDIDRITTGISSSQRNTVLTIKSMIKSEIDSMPMGSSVPLSKIYEDAEKAGIDSDKVDSAISVLKREGEIFEPKPSFIKLL
ncbi:ATP-binding protein [Candidatus Parvarchaeota archaeon]|nr:ATP-binding protein [Candidatus Parvarchaeota archaeon]